MLIYYNNDEIDSESQKIHGTVINNAFNNTWLVLLKVEEINYKT